MKGGGKARKAQGEVFGQREEYLSGTYDAAIMQATANIFLKNILHPLQVEYGSARMAVLKKQGYQSITGYPESLFKIYYPQTPSVVAN